MLAAFGEVHFKNQSPSFYTIGLVYIAGKGIYGIIWWLLKRGLKEESDRSRSGLFSTASRQRLDSISRSVTINHAAL